MTQREQELQELVDFYRKKLDEATEENGKLREDLAELCLMAEGGCALFKKYRQNPKTTDFEDLQAADAMHDFVQHGLKAAGIEFVREGDQDERTELIPGITGIKWHGKEIKGPKNSEAE